MAVDDVAERLPPLLDLRPDALPSNATLNDVVSGYLRRDGRRERLYRRVRQIVDGLGLSPETVDGLTTRVRYVSAVLDDELTKLEGAELHSPSPHPLPMRRAGQTTAQIPAI